MKKVISTILIVSCLVMIPTSVLAQGEAALEKYNADRKEPWIAGGLELLIPTTGHIYAGDWPRSLPFVLGYAAGFAVFIASNSGGEMHLVPLFLGLTVMGVSMIWSAMDAYRSVEEYNNGLKKKYGLSSIRLLDPAAIPSL
jgi:hypothetical protein